MRGDHTLARLGTGRSVSLVSFAFPFALALALLGVRLGVRVGEHLQPICLQCYCVGAVSEVPDHPQCIQRWHAL